MFTHEQIWRGIDLMAAHAQTSPSGLARRAGLDATTFNPSKRVSADGSKQRWPSTESLSKAMAAANLDFASFVDLVTGRIERKGLRAADLSDAADGPVFRMSGEPAGQTELPLPRFNHDQHQAVRVSGAAMAPFFRDGDVLVLDRLSRPEPGHRVLVEFRTGEIMAFELRGFDVQSVRLNGLWPDAANRQVALSEISSIQRIVWASQ